MQHFFWNFYCNLIGWDFSDLWLTNVTSHSLPLLLLFIDDQLLLVEISWTHLIKMLKKFSMLQYQCSMAEYTSFTVYQIPIRLITPVRHIGVSMFTGIAFVKVEASSTVVVWPLLSQLVSLYRQLKIQHMSSFRILIWLWIRVVDLVEENISYKFCRINILPISIIEGAVFILTSRVPSNYQHRQILYLTKNVVKVTYCKTHSSKIRFG